MQYAIIRNRILAAEEYQALMQHGEDIPDQTPRAGDARLKLVYGTLKPQVGETPLQAMQDTRETLGCWYGAIRGGRCRLSTLLDIEFHEPLYRGLAVDIPFAALMRTDLQIGLPRQHAIPCFVRYQGMQPADNLLDRPGILCLCRQENRPRPAITEAGWREAIRPERPLQCARACT